MKLRTRIAAVIAISISSVVALVGATLYAATRDGLRSQVQLRVSHLAAGLRDRLDSGLRERVQYIKTFAALDMGLAPESLAPALARVQASHRAYAWVGFVDAAGRVRASAGEPTAGQDFSRLLTPAGVPLAASLTHLRNSDGATELPVAFPTGSPLFGEIVVPVFDSRERPIGMVVAEVSRAWVQQVVDETLEAGGVKGVAELLVVGPGRIVLVGPIELRGRSLPERLAADASNAYAERAWPDGRVYAMATSVRRDRDGFGSFDWRVIARLDQEKAFQAADRLAEYLLLAGAGIVVLGALAGWLFAGRLARPMERWASVADRIGTGQVVEFPSAAGSYELNRLSAALKSMAARLAEKEEALQARIAERTTQLLEATRALEEERERLAYALEGSRLALWDLDMVTGRVLLSEEWARMVGGPEGPTITTAARLAEHVPVEEHAMLYRATIALLKGTSTQYDVEHRFRRDDGEAIWIRCRGHVTQRSEDGRALRATGTNADITSRKLFEASLREREHRLRLVAENLPVMINYLDRDFRFLYANKRYLEFFGAGEKAVIGRALAEVAGAQAQEAAASFLPRLRAGESVEYERMHDDREGQRRYLEVRLVPHRDEAGQLLGFFSLIDDVTERKKVELRLQHEAFSDSVTGLPNQRLFADRLAQCIAKARREGALLALLFADLDDFKAVNDNHGHAAGDDLLRQVGARFGACVRASDTVARLGGDEFGVLLDPVSSADNAEGVAVKLIRSLEDPFVLFTGAEARVGISIGVALYPRDGEDPGSLLRAADQAMYRAKQGGKGWFRGAKPG